METKTNADRIREMTDEELAGFLGNVDLTTCCNPDSCEPEMNGLSLPWSGYGAVFCNPPYGREIGKWVQKAYSEHVRGGVTIVMLIPARTDTSYFHDYIYGKAEIWFLRGRLKFEDENGSAMNPAPFPSMVVIFR